MLPHLSICAQRKTFINITFGGKTLFIEHILYKMFMPYASSTGVWNGGAVLIRLKERFTADDASHAHWVMKI